MKKRIILFIIFFTLSLGTFQAKNVHAFDGEKSGFVLGLGPGLGWARNDLTFATESKFAVKSDFLIGLGLGNGQTLITWSSKVLWYDSGGITIASGTGGLGLTHFLNQDSDSMYFSGVIGFNSISAPFESNTTDEYGFGLGIGIGKEFSKNWLIGLDGSWGKPGSGVTTFGVGLHFSHLWY